VNERLIANDADVLRVEVSTDELESALAQVALSNRLTPEQLAAEVARQGFTMQVYRSMLRQQILEMRWLLLRKAKGGVGPDSPQYGDFLEAEKKRLLTELRARATIEVVP
jgi:peptidyl-prolyl cis-trans isomerase SurA